MNKTLIACTLALSLLLLGGCDREQVEAYIDADLAKSLALQDAGLTLDDVDFDTIVLDKRNGLDYYQLSFTANGQTYTYNIDALTGKVIERATPAAASSASQAASSIPQPEPSSQAAPSSQASSQATAASSGSASVAADKATITAEDAKAKALAHAGLTASQVSFVRAKLDWDDGKQVYDVEFYTGNKEYDYEIDAYTGAVVGYDYDADNYTPDATSGATSRPSGSGTTTDKDVITAEDAKAKALAHAGLTASQVSFVRAELDWDDGKRSYDVEFYTGNKEYDYEIDAYTGAVLGYDYDADNYAPPAASGSSITADAAKKIALGQVPGATSQNIYEFETDYDDGRLAYEGKIIYDGTEYEFEIDGYSGAIRSWEVEPVGR